jgi:hypothetical protein
MKNKTKKKVQAVCRDTSQELFESMMIIQEENEEAADRIQELAVFLDSCAWAIAFGGDFSDEIVLVLNEVLDEPKVVASDELRGVNQDCLMFDEIQDFPYIYEIGWWDNEKDSLHRK